MEVLNPTKLRPGQQTFFNALINHHIKLNFPNKAFIEIGFDEFKFANSLVKYKLTHSLLVSNLGTSYNNLTIDVFSDKTLGQGSSGEVREIIGSLQKKNGGLDFHIKQTYKCESCKNYASKDPVLKKKFAMKQKKLEGILLC